MEELMIVLVRKHQLYRIAIFILGLIFLVLSGCTVKLISSYDEKTDIAVSDLQKRMEAFFLTLESLEGLPECAYEYHAEVYRDIKVEVSAIEVRARAIPDNDITIQQISLLKENVDMLEQLHKMSCLTKDQIEPLRINFNSGFTAILKLELAKKRGD
jgi:hypothetical protein